jgi:tRNA threonylcarbamoyladenosine biosynthesis protein TsaB
MKILAIETSGQTFSAAVSENGKVLSEIFTDSGHIHSDKLVPSINKLLKTVSWNFAEIDKIAVSTGPGSFTGIRVGLTCARVLGQAMNIPVVGINTLELLRAAVPDKGCTIVAAIDAGRGEVYVNTKSPEIIEAKKYFSSFKKTKNPILVAGNAAVVYSDVINNTLKSKAQETSEIFRYPRAGVLAIAAEKMRGEKYDKVKPLYIRRCWAEEKHSV